MPAPDPCHRRQPARRAGTGRVLDRTDTDHLRSGGVATCRNRRAAVCPACSALYRPRRLPPDRRRTARRQEHPCPGRRPAPAVRHADRAVVRAGASRPGPARPARHAVRAPGASRRQVCGRWHRPDDPMIGTPLDAERLRLHGSGPVQRPRGPAVGAVRQRDPPRARRSSGSQRRVHRGPLHRPHRVRPAPHPRHRPPPAPPPRRTPRYSLPWIANTGLCPVRHRLPRLPSPLPSTPTRARLSRPRLTKKTRSTP